ncbi:alpha/beta fold hydrolase [Methanospirillum lacunae]|uniref:Alpha/beta hydrolase n=1 Tax=Methanospirillum lacunae TaxID=668570 RepID=A0A2V2N1U6_9EURY|nr:alpha/beta fold hydrolase [Methanospirillum lacunae]PWR72575.1 alpha/beta hydrolase [Methanospirillum lacunae]
MPTKDHSITIEPVSIKNFNNSIPALVLQPEHPRGVAAVFHSYGGSKEEMLGLGYRVAENNLIACIVDFRGHGQNKTPLNTGISEDVDSVISYCRGFGKVTTIGHSLGGRLALLSDADYKIGISPSLDKKYSENTRNLLNAMRSYRVCPRDIDILFEIQDTLPTWNPESNSKDSLLIYGERDVEEIIKGCFTLQEQGVKTFKIPSALHPDIFLLEETFSIISRQINEWYNDNE